MNQPFRPTQIVEIGNALLVKPAMLQDNPVVRLQDDGFGGSLRLVTLTRPSTSVVENSPFSESANTLNFVPST